MALDDPTLSPPTWSRAATMLSHSRRFSREGAHCSSSGASVIESLCTGKSNGDQLSQWLAADNHDHVSIHVAMCYGERHDTHNALWLGGLQTMDMPVCLPACVT